MIPFTMSIPKKEQDQELLAKLAAEAPGILDWAVHCFNPRKTTLIQEFWRNGLELQRDYVTEAGDTAYTA